MKIVGTHLIHNGEGSQRLVLVTATVVIAIIGGLSAFAQSVVNAGGNPPPRVTYSTRLRYRKCWEKFSSVRASFCQTAKTRLRRTLLRILLYRLLGLNPVRLQQGPTLMAWAMSIRYCLQTQVARLVRTITYRW
jgi:hypothetical protein